MKLIRIMLVVVALGVLGCGKSDRKENQKQTYTCPMHSTIVRDGPGACPICGMALEKAAPSRKQSMRLNQRQRQLANIATEVVRTGMLGSEARVPGFLSLSDNEVVTAATPVDGRIEKLFIKEEGQAVAVGQPLYRIYSERLQAMEDEFLTELRQDDVGKKRAGGQVKSAERKLLLIGMTAEQIAQLAIRRSAEASVTFFSPSRGVVSRLEIAEGRYVSAGDAICTIQNLDRLWAVAQVYAGEANRLRSGTQLNFQTDAGRLASGKIIFMSPETDDDGQTVQVRLAVDNSAGDLLPGARISIALPGSDEKHLILPADAVLHIGDDNQIWIRSQDGSFAPRLVRTGAETGDEVEILEGLEPGDNVVISGAWLLRAEAILKGDF